MKAYLFLFLLIFRVCQSSTKPQIHAILWGTDPQMSDRLQNNYEEYLTYGSHQNPFDLSVSPLNELKDIASVFGNSGTSAIDFVIDVSTTTQGSKLTSLATSQAQLPLLLSRHCQTQNHSSTQGFMCLEPRVENEVRVLSSFMRDSSIKKFIMITTSDFYSTEFDIALRIRLKAETEESNQEGTLQMMTSIQIDTSTSLELVTKELVSLTQLNTIYTLVICGDYSTMLTFISHIRQTFDKGYVFILCEALVAQAPLDYAEFGTDEKTKYSKDRWASQHAIPLTSDASEIPKEQEAQMFLDSIEGAIFAKVKLYTHKSVEFHRDVFMFEALSVASILAPVVKAGSTMDEAIEETKYYIRDRLGINYEGQKRTSVYQLINVRDGKFNPIGESNLYFDSLAVDYEQVLWPGKTKSRPEGEVFTYTITYYSRATTPTRKKGFNLAVDHFNTNTLTNYEITDLDIDYKIKANVITGPKFNSEEEFADIYQQNQDSFEPCILGDFTSSMSKVVYNYFRNRNPFILISNSATAEDLGNNDKWHNFLRMPQNDNFQIKALIELLNRFGWGQTGVLWETGAYGLGLYQNFTEEAPKRQIKLFNISKNGEITNDTAEEGHRRCVELLSSLRRVHARIFIFMGTIETMTKLLRIQHDLGLYGERFTIVATEWLTPSIFNKSDEDDSSQMANLEKYKQVLEGSFGISQPIRSGSAFSEHISKVIQHHIGQDQSPDPFTYYSYDSALLVAYGISGLLKRGIIPSETKELHESLRIQNFDGTTGPFQLKSETNDRREIGYHINNVVEGKVAEIGQYDPLGDTLLALPKDPIFANGTTEAISDGSSEDRECPFYPEEAKRTTDKRRELYIFSGYCVVAMLVIYYHGIPESLPVEPIDQPTRLVMADLLYIISCFLEAIQYLSLSPRIDFYIRFVHDVPNLFELDMEEVFELSGHYYALAVYLAAGITLAFLMMELGIKSTDHWIFLPSQAEDEGEEEEPVENEQINTNWGVSRSASGVIHTPEISKEWQTSKSFDKSADCSLNKSGDQSMNKSGDLKTNKNAAKSFNNESPERRRSSLGLRKGGTLLIPDADRSVNSSGEESRDYNSLLQNRNSPPRRRSQLTHRRRLTFRSTSDYSQDQLKHPLNTFLRSMTGFLAVAMFVGISTTLLDVNSSDTKVTFNRETTYYLSRDCTISYLSNDHLPLLIVGNLCLVLFFPLAMIRRLSLFGNRSDMIIVEHRGFVIFRLLGLCCLLIVDKLARHNLVIHLIIYMSLLFGIIVYTWFIKTHNALEVIIYNRVLYMCMFWEGVMRSVVYFSPSANLLLVLSTTIIGWLLIIFIAVIILEKKPRQVFFCSSKSRKKDLQTLAREVFKSKTIYTLHDEGIEWHFDNALKKKKKKRESTKSPRFDGDNKDTGVTVEDDHGEEGHSHSSDEPEIPLDRMSSVQLRTLTVRKNFKSKRSKSKNQIVPLDNDEMNRTETEQAPILGQDEVADRENFENFSRRLNQESDNVRSSNSGPQVKVGFVEYDETQEKAIVTDYDDVPLGGGSCKKPRSSSSSVATLSVGKQYQPQVDAEGMKLQQQKKWLMRVDSFIPEVDSFDSGYGELDDGLQEEEGDDGMNDVLNLSTAGSPGGLKMTSPVLDIDVSKDPVVSDSDFEHEREGNSKKVMFGKDSDSSESEDDAKFQDNAVYTFQAEFIPDHSEKTVPVLSLDESI